MENAQFHIKYNKTEIASVMDFANINHADSACADCSDETTDSNERQVCFIRALGAYSGLTTDILSVDKMLTQNMHEGNGKYIRINALPQITDSGDIAVYKKSYEYWINGGRKVITSKCLKGKDVEELAGRAFYQVIEKFRACTAGVSASMEQNFAIKLMYWADKVCEVFFQNWELLKNCKFIYSGSLKKQEYLFCYFLTFFGIDVLMLRTENDTEPGKALENLSMDIKLGEFGKCDIPQYHPEMSQSKNIVVNTRRADRDERTRQMQNRQAAIGGNQEQNTQAVAGDSQSGQNRQPVMGGIQSGRQAVIRDSQTQRNSGIVLTPEPKHELAFEELALLASSIVMITIHDKNGKPLGSGSGIMINEQGYILTNNHVACQGHFYSVRIEGDEEVYQTDEMIKYNQLLDLAIIRIDKTLQPVPFYQGEKPLVRGQKVVAIGSPLGLFNSVSDGIISGFRNIDNVDMIQFTAPTSKGSSGGAVFNMYGEVIGISTAEIGYGQNINLAVGYEYINTFIQGFYKTK